jgi:hypothetical protein
MVELTRFFYFGFGGMFDWSSWIFGELWQYKKLFLQYKKNIGNLWTAKNSWTSIGRTGGRTNLHVPPKPKWKNLSNNEAKTDLNNGHLSKKCIRFSSSVLQRGQFGSMLYEISFGFVTWGFKGRSHQLHQWKYMEKCFQQ